MQGYGQLDIANDDLAIKDLLHGLLPDTNESVVELAELRSKLALNREALLSAWEEQDEIEVQVNALPKIKEQIDHYKELGLKEKLANSTKLNKEQQLVDLVSGYIDDVGASLEGLRESIEEEIEGFDADSLKDYPGKQFLSDMKKEVDTFTKKAIPKLMEVEKQYESLQEKQEGLEGKWENNVENINTALSEAVSELPDSAGKKGAQIGREYLALVKQQDEAKPLKKVLKEKKANTKKLEDERFELLNEWRDAQNDRFDLLRKGAKKLHKKHLKGKLQIKPLQWGNRSPLKDFLTSIEGIGEKKVVWVDNVESLSIATLVKKIEDGKEALLDEYKEYGLTSAVANSLTKLSDEQILELEEIELQTRVELRLNVSDQTETYRPIHKLSTGQKCTAILHLLLLEGHEPLIVDQPEDNLDNAFIADRIVTELRAAKRRRQFIFSTHNANIPVFGDSEWIGALREEEGHGVLSGSSVGSIDTDSVRELVSHILEGGKEAFDIRRAKYGY